MKRIPLLVLAAVLTLGVACSSDGPETDAACDKVEAAFSGFSTTAENAKRAAEGSASPSASGDVWDKLESIRQNRTNTERLNTEGYTAVENAMRLAINNPECFTPADVASAQTWLSQREASR